MATAVVKANAEATAFGKRLTSRLLSLHQMTASPTQVCREFNRRAPDQHITPHAARKWLMGETIPRQSKLCVLADWLEVSPEWLQYGRGEITVETTLDKDSKMNVLHSDIMKNLLRLNKKNQHLVSRFIDLLMEP